MVNFRIFFNVTHIENIHRHPNRLPDRFHEAYEFQPLQFAVHQQIQIAFFCSGSLCHGAEQDGA